MQMTIQDNTSLAYENDPTGVMVHQLVIVRNEHNSRPLTIERDQKIHQLLQVSPILTLRGLIQNEQLRS